MLHCTTSQSGNTYFIRPAAGEVGVVMVMHLIVLVLAELPCSLQLFFAAGILSVGHCWTPKITALRMVLNTNTKYINVSEDAEVWRFTQRSNKRNVSLLLSGALQSCRSMTRLPYVIQTFRREPG